MLQCELVEVVGAAVVGGLESYRISIARYSRPRKPTPYTSVTSLNETPCRDDDLVDDVVVSHLHADPVLPQPCPYRRNGPLHDVQLRIGLRQFRKHFFCGNQPVGLLRHVQLVLTGLRCYVRTTGKGDLTKDRLQCIAEHASKPGMADGLMNQHCLGPVSVGYLVGQQVDLAAVVEALHCA